MKVGTLLAFANRIAHKGLHTETRGVSDGGGITTLGAFRTFTNIPGPGVRTANFAAFGSWSEALLKNAESLRDSDALMRVAVPRRRGPAGLRDPVSVLLIMWRAFATLNSATPLYTYISRFSVTHHHQQREKIRQSCYHKFYPPTAFHPAFQLLAQTATFAFIGKSGYTLAFQRKIAHNGLHGETEAVSDRGGITTLGAFRTFRKPCVARG